MPTMYSQQWRALSRSGFSPTVLGSAGVRGTQTGCGRDRPDEAAYKITLIPACWAQGCRIVYLVNLKCEGCKYEPVCNLGQYGPMRFSAYSIGWASTIQPTCV